MVSSNSQFRGSGLCGINVQPLNVMLLTVNVNTKYSKEGGGERLSLRYAYNWRGLSLFTSFPYWHSTRIKTRRAWRDLNPKFEIVPSDMYVIIHSYWI